ncbi:MAG: hypothetical protein ABJA50_12730 [Chloroflexota bacterium]
MGDSIVEQTAQPTQRQPDRFLIGIVAGLILLLIAAAISVLFLRQPAQELPADTPGGTVQRFYIALQKNDYAGAYTYLSDSMVNKPTQAEFTNYNTSYNAGGYNSNNQQGIRIDNITVNGDDATVPVAVTTYYNSGGPFGGSGDYTNTEVFSLHRDNGNWLITILPPRYMPYKP